MMKSEELLLERTRAMTEDEKRCIIKAIPTQILYEELGERLVQQGEFIGRIVTTVQENT